MARRGRHRTSSIDPGAWVPPRHAAVKGKARSRLCVQLFFFGLGVRHSRASRPASEACAGMREGGDPHNRTRRRRRAGPAPAIPSKKKKTLFFLFFRNIPASLPEREISPSPILVPRVEITLWAHERSTGGRSATQSITQSTSGPPRDATTTDARPNVVVRARPLRQQRSGRDTR